MDILDCPEGIPSSARVALESLIGDGFLGSAVYRPQTGSTNTDALTELQHSRPTSEFLPRLHWADRQTGGRGRQGNQWIAEPDALTFSLIMECDKEDMRLSLFVGVAVARAIEFVCAPCRVALKWPNDIYSTDGKLGGILIETTHPMSNAVAVGVGLNINQSPKLESKARQVPATSLAALASRRVDRIEVLTTLVESIVSLTNEPDTDELMDGYRDRCALSGSEVALYQNDRQVSGYCAGVNDAGELELIVNDRRVAFRSGEVHRLRVP